MSRHRITNRRLSGIDPVPANGVLLTLNRLLAATLLLVIAPVAAAHAQGVEGIRSVTLFVGTGLSLAGNAINEGVGTIDGKPSVLVEQALSNHFSDALKLRFTGSLGLDYNKEVFATFAYGKYNGTERIVGSVSGYPLLARLSNADAFDIEGGLRYYLRPEGPIRTYVAGAARPAFSSGDRRDLQSCRGRTDVWPTSRTSRDRRCSFSAAIPVSATTCPTRLRWVLSSGFGTRANLAPNRSLRIRSSGTSTTRAAAGRFRSASSRKRGSDAGTQAPSPAHRSPSNHGCDGICVAAWRHRSSRWP